jgi:hypothetical protein
MSHYVLEIPRIVLGGLSLLLSKITSHGLLIVVFFVSYYIFKMLLAKYQITENSESTDEKPYNKSKKNKTNFHTYKFSDITIPSQPLPQAVETPIRRNSPIYSFKGEFGSYSSKLKEIAELNTLEDFQEGVKHYSDKLNEEKCIEILDRMLVSNIRPDYDILFNLMTLFIKTRKINQALGMFNDIKMNGVALNENTYYVIIKGCLDCEKLEQASDILIQSLRNNTLINREIYNQVACKLVTNISMKQREKVEYINELLSEFQRTSIKVNQLTYANMIRISKKLLK